MTQGELGKLAYEEFVAQGGWRALGIMIPRTWEELDGFAQQVWMMVGSKVCTETQRELAMQGRLPNG